MSTTQTANRYRIEGLLMTEAPLHVGCGRRNTFTAPRNKASSHTAQFACIERDARGRPCIPGSALKGVVAQWARNLRPGDKAWASRCDDVFGRAASDLKGDMGTGGKVEFRYAIARPRTDTVDRLNWDQAQGTYVEPHVVIDRRTGAAADELLHHREMVPSGTVFDVVITGEHLSDDELDCLLSGLAGFNHQHPGVRARLGAGTYDGCGKMRWKLRSIGRLDKDTLEDWLAGGKCGYDGFVGIPKLDLERFERDAQRAASSRSADGWLRIAASLTFDRAFLVSVAGGAGEKDPDLVPLLSPGGRALLPGSSLRGPLRSQAERILRTVGARACAPDCACPSVRSKNDLVSICLACRTFGASGWGTPIMLDDFEAVSGTLEENPQMFNPHDRLVGGTAQALSGAGMLHSVQTAHRPVFALDILLDLRRLADSPASFGLLAHVAADFHDGDIRFGYGTGKGFGRCTVRLCSWSFGPNSGEWNDVDARQHVGHAVAAFQQATGTAQTGGNHAA